MSRSERFLAPVAVGITLGVLGYMTGARPEVRRFFPKQRGGLTDQGALRRFEEYRTAYKISLPKLSPIESRG